MIQFDKYQWHWKNGTARVHINSNPQSNILHTHFYTSTNWLISYLSYLLKEFFQQIKKFDSWSNHFIWKDTLTVTNICLFQEVQKLHKAIHRIWYAHHNIRYAHTFVLFNFSNTISTNTMANYALNMTETSVSQLA